MKNKLVILFLFLSLFLYPDNVYGPFGFTRLSSEPVHWYPEEGIYNDTIYLSLTSEYGRIYYLVNEDFNKKELKEYKRELVLKGIEGGIVDYNILVVLEKANSNVEIYSRTYRIDRTKKYERGKSKIKEYVSRDISYEENKIKALYRFNDNKFGIQVNEREFNFPVKTTSNENNYKEIELLGNETEKKIYLAAVSYEKEGKKYTEVHNYSIDLKIPDPPTFGSLFWGQIYRQSYKIRIKTGDPENKIFYWLREWKNDDLIVGPPLQTNAEKWLEYTEPIKLESKYGKDGIMGIAAFALSKNGIHSEISGPFYFKIADVDNTMEQVFKEEPKKESAKKVFFINDKEYDGNKLIIDEKVDIRFINFDKDDNFYFVFKNKSYEGKSDLFPCIDKYTFKNSDSIPVGYELFLANGKKLGAFTLNNRDMKLPILRRYAGNYVDLSSDEIVEFYMPNYDVKYEASTNLTKTLDVTKKSDNFYGSIKISAKEGQEREFKIKFGSFDDNNNLLSESDDYYFKLDKKMPINDVSSDGIDFNLIHNEKQVLKLIPPESDGKIYYRLSTDDAWIEYEELISFYPPLYGKYSLNIYTKFIDDADNERENKEPFVLTFDTRAIFVDNGRMYSGNGTESAPYNSIDRAIEYAKRKNIKLIYIVSGIVNTSFPMKIESDVIIQTYHNDSKTQFVMDTKSIWRKKHLWFDVKNNGYLELRNIDFNIKSGSCFANLEGSKLKIYNATFTYTGKDDFCLIENKGGKLGISSLFLDIANKPENFTFIDTSKSSNILRAVNVIGYANDIDFLKIDRSNYFLADGLTVDLSGDGDINFGRISNSNVIFKRILYKQHGNFQNSLLYDVTNSSLFLEESDFVSEGMNPFSLKLFEEKNSEVKIISSLFRVTNSSSVIGFGLDNSNILFEKSIMDVQNIKDYAYGFRLKNSNIKISSSVLRNSNCSSAISFILAKSKFEGANNSIFNIDISGKSFDFWITEIAEITTVNSLYYFNDQNENNAFIYFNNKNYDLLKPIWYSNAVSTGVILLENLMIKDANSVIKDFGEKNIFHTFIDEFNMEDDNFFIPLKDSPILQGGLPEYLSPLRIPEKDFLGKNRIIPGIGIDIGAIQKSGNF